MKQFLIITIIAICTGCSTHKSPESQASSTKDIVSVTISLDGDNYKAQAKWIKFNNNEKDNVVSTAGTTSLLNSWSCAKVIDTTNEYSSKIKTLLSNEIVEVENGYGTTFGVKAKLLDEKIHAKGIFIVTSKNQYLNCSFDGYFEEGKSRIVYEKSEFFDKSSVEPIQTGPFKPIEGGTPLFK